MSFSDRTSSRRQPSKQNKHLCTYPHCGWSFKRYEHLKRHMLIHSGERPHACPYPGCGKRFSRSDNFHAHYRTHAKKALEKGAPVSDTPSSSVYHPGFSRPMTNEQERFPFQFRPRPPLSEEHRLHHASSCHFPIHSNGTPYMSSECHQQQQQHTMDTTRANSCENPMPSRGTTFSPPSSSSEDDKHHTCPHDDCQRRFKRLEHLKRHMRIHTLERPFQCTFVGCNKSFSRSDNLTQHLKTHERRESRYHARGMPNEHHTAYAMSQGSAGFSQSASYMNPMQPSSSSSLTQHHMHNVMHHA